MVFVLKDIRIKMKTQQIIAGFTLITFICLLGLSTWMAPYTMEHGYYVTTAKLMTEGMIPWKDFNLMDAPLGVFFLSIPYFILGKSSTGAIALTFTFILHLANMALLGKILRIQGVSKTIRLFGLIAYVIGLCASYGFSTTLEPFAVFFMLLAIQSQSSSSSYKIFWMGGCLCCAILCKIQVLALLPALCVYATIDIERKELLRVAGITGGLLLLSYLLLSLLSGNWYWISYIDLSIHTAPQSLYAFAYSAILFVFRIGALLLLPLLFFFKYAPANEKKRICSAILAACGIIGLSMVGYDKSWPQLCFPLLIICFCASYAHIISQHKWASIFLLFLAAPIGLMGWEIKKLEFGHRKEHQKHLLETTALRIHEMPDTIHLIAFHCTEYDLGPQVFSELNKVPFNLKSTRYGFTKWDKPTETFDGVGHAKLIMAPYRVLFGFNNLEEPKGDRTWEKTFDDLFNQRIVWAIDEDLMFMSQDAPFYTQEEIEELIRAEEEHEHDHHHEHDSHHLE